MRASAMALMLATACGRIGFDAVEDGGPRRDAPACTASSPPLESVRSGTFVMGAAEAMHDQPITVPLDRSVLFFSVREAEPTPNYGAIECDLTATAISCIRPLPGTDFATSTGQLFVSYTVATFSSGVTVQRGVQQPGTTPVAISPVPLASSFVLLAGDGTDNGNSWGTNEYQRAQLFAQQLDLFELDNSQQVSWQVVTFDGASVERGTASLAAADASASVPLVSATPQSFPLVSYTSDSNMGLGARFASLLARIDQSSLVMQREPGGSPLDISWEVITLPFEVTRGETAFAAGQLQATELVPGLNGTAAAVIASNQAVLGQSGGSTTFTTAIPGADDMVGEASVTLTPSDGQITLERSTAIGDARIAWAAIDLSRPTCP